MRPVAVYLPLLTLGFFLVSLSSLFAQTTQDSLISDSLDKVFRRQSIENNKNIGLDTTYSGERDTLTFDRSSADSVIQISKEQRRPRGVRRFYWNERKANADSLGGSKKYRHSPLHASLFSMVLPGLGQAYNRRYWKIPIIYAGFGGLGYAIYHTGSNFNGYRSAYRLQVDGDPNTLGSYKGVEQAATLKEYRDFFKRNLDITVICTAVWYILNVVDAAVDAHLFEWNMNDDLNLSWHPTVITSPGYTHATAGVRLNFNF
jgi:hypothetical protein